MIAFSKLEPDMVLWERKRSKMGNTTMTKLSEYPVRIVSIDADRRSASVVWNSNPPTTWYESRLKKLFRDRMPREVKARG